jgi:hypothetical protein
MLDQLPPGTIEVAFTLIAAIAAYFGGKKKEASRKITEFETEFRQLLRKQNIFPSPKVKRRSREYVDEALQENIEEYDGDSVPFDVYLSDNNYFLPTSPETMAEAKLFNVFEYLPYRPERFDCEDYASAYMTFTAFLFGTNSVGTVYDYSSEHAYNIIIYADGTMELFEPQTGKVVERGEDYQLQSGFIVL